MIVINGYTEKELDYLKDNFAKLTKKQLAKQLNKSENSISYATSKLGLVKQKHKPWTPEEDEFLKTHYIDMTSTTIGKALGRSVHSINARRDDLKLVRNPNWNEVEVKYLMEHYDTMSYEEIGKVLGRTAQAVDAKCFDLNLYKKELPWSTEELEFLKKNYSSIQTSELAEIMNRSHNAIKLKADRIGLKKYPYYCDYHFFDNIDTEEKAYWLGFITADGWVSENHNTGSGILGIELQYKDINHLRKFNKSIKGNYKITDRWKTCPISGNDNKNHMCYIRVFSIAMVKSLEKQGICPNKTKTVTMSDIPIELQRHYLRGLFDGDGCFSVSNNRVGVRFCTASESLKNDLIRILANNMIDIKDYSDGRYNYIHYPEVVSKENKIKLLEYMYKDSNIYLERKYKKYLKAMKILKDNGHAL